MRRRRRSANWLILHGLLLAAWITVSVGAADVIIHLKNGDRVTGQIVLETATEVSLKSPALGTVTISVGQILKREEVVTVPLVGTSTNHQAVVTAPPPAPPAVTNMPPVVPVKPKYWNSEIQLGLNLRYTTRDQQEALVVAKSSYVRGRFREILDYNFAYGEAEGVLSANRMGGSSKTEWDVTPRVYTFGLVGGGYDEIRQIDWQFEANPGVGYQWVKKPDFSFKTEVGLSYQDQQFTDGREFNTYSGRLAGIFTWRVWDKLLADAKAEYFPNVTSSAEYRLRFESTIRYPLMKNLSLNLIVIDLYDTQAPRGVENNDLQVRSAIGIKF